MKFKSKKKGNKFAKAKYTLPTVDTEPMGNIEDYSFLIYGPPGTGKTTLANQMKIEDRPNLMMMAEDGTKALRCRPVHIRKWPDAEAYLQLLVDSQEYGGGVLDTAEALYEHSRRYHLKKLEVEHENDAPYGKGWAATRDPFTDWLKRFLSIPDKGAVVISHSTRGTRKSNEGDEVEDVHPNIPGKVLDEVTGAVDVVGYLYRAKGQNWLRIRQTDDIMAKCRLVENFQHTDGTPVALIPMGNSPAESYEALVTAFNNELEPPPPPEKRKKAKLKFGKR